ncbi:MAG: Shedu anti-phage system protein SduA domain-containing protein [Candidatus Zixiibacteriota bacterium]
MVRKRLRYFQKAPIIEEIIAKQPLKEFFVWWDDIAQKDVDAFHEVLNNARHESEIQTFLERDPILLIQHLGGGHGRWVVPKKRLGVQYVTDFVIGERSSYGFEWQGVELENPNAPMFTRSGDPSRQLTHAIRQIQDWRAWLQRNQNYAARSESEGGLGLIDITAKIPGLILIGRRKNVDSRTNELRRQMINDIGIMLHTYDFLIDSAQGRIKASSISR